MKRTVLLSCVLTLFCLSVITCAQEKPTKPVEYTSQADVAEDADLKRDFDTQGEYVGKVGDQKLGMNLIADGGGKFRLVVFVGGLPGDGWSWGDTRVFGKAQYTEDGKIDVTVEKIEDADGRRNITEADTDMIRCTGTFDGDLTFSANGQKYVFTKVNRESETLGKKAPDGALVLFADGKASDMFDTVKVNEVAKTLWSEASTKPFEKKPYTLHIEFMLSYMPEARGQARSNSGVYIDEAYECQVLDSFGLEGENNECGGFYTVAKPIVNMCFPPLRWQTYDIDFVPAKFAADGTKTDKAIISVKHNGVLIQNEIRPEKETPGRKQETPEPRGLYLQGHGNKVQYNNIWLKYAE